MRKKLLIALIIFIGSNLLANEIIVKTNTDFTKQALKNYLSNNYIFMDGETKIDYFISNRELFDPKNDQFSLLNKKANINSLKNIFVVKYESMIDPIVASGKLNSDKNFQYVEPLPKRELQLVPNDSLYQDQYYLQNINIEEAWEIFDEGDEIVVAIVDTGIDLEHEDLKDNIWENPGESGIDENRNDKSSNGIDDDANGYIDDLFGWDFMGELLQEDNDPRPGNRHGTHVAGIVAASTNNTIGVAGVALNTKLMAVKIGPDNPNIRGVSRGYDAIIYAAVTGADIINCSWGGGGFSNAENEMIQVANNLGSLIIAAAGNDNSNAAFYPAAYDNVISVASTGAFDTKSGFSNYHSSVDISAPGSQIMNTVFNNEYDRLSGTSMASPVVAGIASLVKQSFSDFDSRKLGEQLKATADPKINTGNYQGLLGAGLAKADEAISNKNAKNISLFNYAVRDIDEDQILESGDEIEILFVLENILNPINDVKYSLEFDDNIESQTTDIREIGFFEVEQKITRSETITLPDSLPLDFNFPVKIKVEGEEYSRDFVITFNVNQSYRNLSSELIDLTINSRGNFAYNDYPANEQGLGFKYLDQESILFEGGMIVSSSSNSISSVVRSSNQSVQGSDFIPLSVAKVEEYDLSNLIYSSFTDNALEDKAGVEIEKEYILPKEGELAGVVFVKNKVKNISNVITDSLYLGYFFDWDIGQGGSDNISEYWQEENIGFQYNAENVELPFVAVALVSEGDFIFYPLDNDGSSTINPGVYDGFTKWEQWRTLTGDITREKSNQTDASMVFGSGPFSLAQEETQEIDFVIMTAETKEEFPELLKKAKESFNALNVEEDVAQDSFISLYPNPVQDYLNINFERAVYFEFEINIYNISGELVLNQARNVVSNNLKIDISNFDSGTYILELKNDNYTLTEKFIVE